MPADFSKIRSRLPKPPAPEEAPGNLQAPETAPVDGRSARATGRTQQFSTRVREEFYDEVKIYAAMHRMKLVEVLEAAFAALKEKESQKSSR